MELYYVISIIDRSRAEKMVALHKEVGINVCISNLGRGTAKKAHLDLHELEATEKTVINAIASGPSVKQLMKNAKRKLYIDIPGNGIMLSIPMKSVAGSKTLEFMTKDQTVGGTVPKMKVNNELIIIILNEGHSDSVMDAAREAGATGGTVLHAKGTGSANAEKFFGVSIAEEKDLIYILAPSKKKSDIMKAVNEKCGVGTEAGAVSFSLPVSEVAGIRRIDD
jgi:nitrogen regulatory protein PII